ncbi:restriction endonuclease [Mycobacteroides stephanolepidis]|uniref:Restriction endonuclease n=1 Tax=[Mycobacterium] stephanolepidis TaxID=1520670 RepID=A0A1Z4EV19_9MYCO|nr:restriction endonuclease [[Mycobacterium] stephanolepidis]BAX96797.1 restriction endonuclease [[Mycobacterium] stephanolepidis]
MTAMWMVRGGGGRLYDIFRERGVVGIGWREIAAKAKPGATRKELIEAYREAVPGLKDSSAVSGASQVYRFVNEVHDADLVVTYSPTSRTYLVGTFTGTSEYHPEWEDDNLLLARKVDWCPREVSRDSLTPSTRNSLGSVLTVFRLPDAARNELAALARNEAVVISPPDDADEDQADPLTNLESIEAEAFERIKDRVRGLSWIDMQELVAGVLRAMGYKTQVSPPGSDRGRDILASPDGFGFAQPRITVEVKHRSEKIGSDQVRSFLGGRHAGDRGLYVSTGGFTNEARYEADRANVPLMLWTLDEVTRALLDNYADADLATRRLLPLRTFHVPA